MQKSLFKKGVVIGILILFIGLSATPLAGGVREKQKSLIDKKTATPSEEVSSIDNDTEYRALLIAGGLYAGHPEYNIPELSTEVEMLHDLLLVSKHWKDKNIRVIKGMGATLCNIIRGFLWLDRKEDENDISVVYITTHGGLLSKDKWPYDEDDGHDEALLTFLGGLFPWTNLRDDLFSILLSLLDSKGVCVIVDSCFAGGFNDTPFHKTINMNDNNMNAEEFIQEFAEELSGSGRVVLMSSRENESTYGGFTIYLMEGLTGYADANEDDFVSAEEAFYYAEEKITLPDMHPIMYDDYPGELQLTVVEFRPSIPTTPIGQVLGDTNTYYNYSTVSTDPKGDNISYGWDWDGDYIVDEWTDFIASNITINISHSWTVEGTYNIRVRAKDEHNLLSDWSDHIVVMMCSDNIPDQQQTIIDKGEMFMDYWLAQSFIPSLNTLSKVELAYSSYGLGDPKPLQIYIRDNLSGDNLAECSRVIPSTEDETKYAWFTFDFDDLNVIPGSTYYIVCKGASNWVFIWKGKDGNPYPLGKAYHSADGDEWHSLDNAFDFCFVTWAVKK